MSAAAPAPPTEDVGEAWRRWLAEGIDLPGGLRPFLHSADVAADEEGRIVIRPVPGPAHERLAQPTILAHIAEGLSRHMGHRPEVVVRAPEEPLDPERRITVEEVRSDTMKALFRQEPRLERAVEELDLELMD